MKLDFAALIPENYNDESRVWIYQSSRLFTLGEALNIEKQLQDFVAGWTSHSDQVKGYANLLFGQFIVLIADETASKVSGCSTDSSVRLIKEIEQQYHVSLFDRQSLAFFVKDKIQVLPMHQLQYAFDNKFIDGETLYFNNTILTKKELLGNWVVPIKDSWIAKRFPVTV